MSKPVALTGAEVTYPVIWMRHPEEPEDGPGARVRHYRAVIRSARRHSRRTRAATAARHKHGLRRSPFAGIALIRSQGSPFNLLAAGLLSFLIARPVPAGWARQNERNVRRGTEAHRPGVRVKPRAAEMASA